MPASPSAHVGPQPVDGPGQGEVQQGEAARVVGREGEPHGVPADVDVGVVVGRLGRGADGVDERERGGEVVQLDRRDELVVFARPVQVLLFERRIDVGLRQHGFTHGWVMSSGRTAASNCSAVRWPSASAASLSVEPSLWAFFATSAALS